MAPKHRGKGIIRKYEAGKNGRQDYGVTGSKRGSRWRGTGEGEDAKGGCPDQHSDLAISLAGHLNCRYHDNNRNSQDFSFPSLGCVNLGPRRLERHKLLPCTVQAGRTILGSIWIPFIPNELSQTAIVVGALNCGASLARNYGSL